MERRGRTSALAGGRGVQMCPKLSETVRQKVAGGVRQWDFVAGCAEVVRSLQMPVAYFLFSNDDMRLRKYQTLFPINIPSA